MTIAALIAVPLLVLAPAQETALQLGSVPISIVDPVSGKSAVQSVPITFPKTPGPVEPNAPSVAFGGWKFRVMPDGSIGAPYLVDGGWADVAAAYGGEAPSQPPIPWKVKVFLLTRAAILERSAEGILRIRRSTLESSQVQQILQDLARFQALVEADSGKRLRVEISVEADDTPVRLRAQSPGPLLDAKFVEETLSPRVNGHPFDADDRVDRGPYHSVFFIFAGLTPGGATTVVRGMPVTGISPYIDGPEGDPFGLTMQLMRAWVVHVAARAQAKGYGVAASPQGGMGAWPSTHGLITAEMWPVVADLAPPADADFVRRKYVGHQPRRMAWSEARADPWVRLPRLDPAQVETATGGAISAKDLASRPRSAVVSSGVTPSGSVHLVGSAHADLFGTLLPGSEALGYVVEQDNYVLFASSRKGPISAEINALSVDGLEVFASPSVAPEPTRIEVAGVESWSLKSAAGEPISATAGSVNASGLAVLEAGGKRRWVYLPQAAPADVAVPRFAVIGPDQTVKIPCAVRGNGVLRWSTPPAWKAGFDGAAGLLTIVTDGSAGTVSVHVEVDGWTSPQRAVRIAPAQWSERLIGTGQWSAVATNDPEQGRIVTVTESGNFRRGEAQLAGNEDGFPLFDITTHPRLTFRLASTAQDPVALRFKTTEGAFEVALAQVVPLPPEVATHPGVANVPAGYDGRWRTVTLDFAQLGLRSGLVTAVSAGPPSSAKYYERRHLGDAAYQFGAFALQGAPPPEPQLPLPEDDAQVLVRTAAALKDSLSPADETALQAMLADKRDFVRLNAANVLTRIRVPSCVAPLADLTRSANEWVAQVALEALAFQDTPESWGAIRACLESGPFDFTRALAARTMLSKADPKLASPFSFLLTARNWRHRATGAHCIGALPGREAAIILMSFLRDLDPCVRMAVISGANPDLDLVCRRLLQAAVNDPSEVARAAAYCKLATSPIAEYQAEGAKGVRDESPYVRLAILEWMRSRGVEQDRGAIRLAVTDAFAVVRAAALRAFAALPGSVELAEIANVLSDSDPRVQRELIALARAKGLVLDEATKAQLAASVDAEVARLAKGLGE